MSSTNADIDEDKGQTELILPNPSHNDIHLLLRSCAYSPIMVLYQSEFTFTVSCM